MKLLLKDGKQLIMTNSWTVAGQGNNALAEVCYTWGADGVSFFSGATGTRRVGLTLTMGQLRSMLDSPLSKCSYIDLRPYCR